MHESDKARLMGIISSLEGKVHELQDQVQKQQQQPAPEPGTPFTGVASVAGGNPFQSPDKVSAVSHPGIGLLFISGRCCCQYYHILDVTISPRATTPSSPAYCPRFQVYEFRKVYAQKLFKFNVRTIARLTVSKQVAGQMRPPASLICAPRVL